MSKDAIPACVGIIMDGNRRYARERGLPTFEGHRRGLEKFKETTEWLFDAGVGTALYYAFSTENWNRAPEEVSYLMKLFASAIENELTALQKRGACVRFLGDLSRLHAPLREAARTLEEETKNGTKGTIVVALSYGGRPEILAAVNKLLAEGKREVDEISFRKAMWSADIPDPDLIIRTGGEKRLSNFLPWQSVYSEFAFTDTKWPAFSREELTRILADFTLRERRRGA